MRKGFLLVVLGVFGACGGGGSNNGANATGAAAPVVAPAAPSPEPPATGGNQSTQSDSGERPSFERWRDLPDGGGIVSPFGAAQTPAQLESIVEPRVRMMVGNQLNLGGFRLADRTSRLVGDKWFINYQLELSEIPLSRRSYADVVMGATDGDVRTVRARNVPTNGVDGTTATVTESQAIALARAQSAQALKLSVDDKVLEHSNPRLAFEAGSSETDKAQLCWIVTISVDDDIRPHRVTYSIKAIGDPSVLYRENLIKDDHHGRVRGPRWDVTPLQAPVDGPLPYTLVTRATPNARSNADASGAYRMPGSGAASMTGALESQFFRVLNRGAGGDLTVNANGSESSPIYLAFAAANEYEIAQVSAFVWAHRAREFASSLLSASDLKGTRVIANVPDTCNASFTAPADPSDTAVLRLFRGGASSTVSGRQCVNRAYADTVFHEFAHGIDWVLKGWTAASYAEGFSDAVTILFTRSSCYGRDSYQDAAGMSYCLRPANNSYVWPGNGLTDHQRGSIYSGFVLELVAQLKATLSMDQTYALATRLTLEAAAANPRDIQDAVFQTLRADDNDKNLTNHTPHYKQIRAAATSKGLWKASWP